MNYRHIYHAGNICDVTKHVTLCMLIEHLRAKDSAFVILDTHAGTGLYDLLDERAGKTAEAQTGIQAFLSAPAIPEAAPYYRVLQALNPDRKDSEPLRYYPGSPLIAAHMLRPHDRLVACELHEEDAQELRTKLGTFKAAHIHHRDGYESFRAFLPPTEKRGLVLIDPPYEKPDELGRLPQILAEAHKRWPTGMFMLWYPIKERPALWRFHEVLVATGMQKQLCAEFIYNDEARADRLNGSGLILINPPWQMDEKLRALFPILHQALGTTAHNDVVKWLTV